MANPVEKRLDVGANACCHIYNTLCLNDGVKNHVGFSRMVENYIMVNHT
jgi:hypothetical protein